MLDKLIWNNKKFLEAIDWTGKTISVPKPVPVYEGNYQTGALNTEHNYTTMANYKFKISNIIVYQGSLYANIASTENPLVQSKNNGMSNIQATWYYLNVDDILKNGGGMA